MTKWKIPHRYTRFMDYKIPVLKKCLKPIKRKIKEIPDPRGEQGKDYPLDYVLELYSVSCLCGYCDCVGASEFLKSKHDIVAEFIPLAKWKDIPSHDCFNDVLAIVGKDKVRSLLTEFYQNCRRDKGELPNRIITTGIEWQKVEESCHKNGRPFKYIAKEREVVIKKHTIVDGKASKGATDKKHNGKTPYTGGFYDGEGKLYSDAVDIPNGKEEGEVTKVREALAEKDLHYELLTLDALHCKKETLATIFESKGEFLQRLKEGSHSVQFKLITDEIKVSGEKAEIDKKRLEAALDRGETISTPDLDRYQKKEFTDYNKSRVTKTTIEAVVDDNNVCSEYSPYISQLIYLKSRTTELIKNEDGSTEEKEVSEYECCFIASCILDIDDIYQLVKEHWSIESSHWVLDNIFSEDRSTGRKGNQIYNRAVFKRLAYNMMRMLEFCIEEMKDKSTNAKFIFLRGHFELALMMVDGFSVNYCSKMAKVYEKRKEAYLQNQKEVDFSKINEVRI